MAGQARVGDIGVGVCSHREHDKPINMVGSIVNGAPSVMSNYAGSATSGVSIVLSTCGHVGIIAGGSSMVQSDVASNAHVGSPFSGDFSGIIVTGSEDVNVGE
jgi:hypothetical protein